MITLRCRHLLAAAGPLAALVLVRVLATVLANRAGFSALSDDDYARVTIAQSFAAAPRLDPSGTSWLPAPFWCTGMVMLTLGRSLLVAQHVQLVLSSLCAAGLYAAAHAAGVNRTASIAGALAASAMPVAVFTGAALVPELPTATLCAAALLLLRRPHSLWPAALVLPATLSRYEAWPVAMAVALCSWWPRRQRPLLTRRLGISALAVAGPVAWVMWNACAHGDAMHFHSRVSAYWFASGGQRVQALLDLLQGYPLTALTGAPVLVAALVIAVVVAAKTHPGSVTHWARSSSATIGGALLMVAFLFVAELTGGMPTHHPERALMTVWLVGWVLAADLTQSITQHVPRLRPVAIAAVALSVGLLAWQTYQALPHYGTNRSTELAVARLIQSHDDTGTVLVEPDDYGYFAIMAGLGAPERVVLARSIDPRNRQAPASSPFAQLDSLRARASQTQARWLVVPTRLSHAATQLDGIQHQVGTWTVVQMPSGAQQ